MARTSVDHIYSVNFPTLDRCRAYLEEKLATVFEARENASYGDYFCVGNGSQRRLLLIVNELDDGEPAELDLPEFRFLLYFYRIEERPETAALLSQCVLDGKLTLVALVSDAGVVPVRPSS